MGNPPQNLNLCLDARFSAGIKTLLNIVETPSKKIVEL